MTEHEKGVRNLFAGPRREAASDSRAKRFLTPFSFRRGISLVEVLISMGILSLGLLGVAAIFPVGGYYVQSGDTYDSADAVAQAALADAAARGWLDPKNWVGCERSFPTSGPLDRPAPTASMIAAWKRKYVSPFAALLREDLARNASQNVLSHLDGSAYAIDPLGVSVGARNLGSVSTQNIEVSNFPASAQSSSFVSAAWSPWNSDSRTWPVHRLSLRATDPTGTFPYFPLGQRQAQAICISSDDLALEVPPDAARPIQQRLSALNGVAVQRQSKGEFSWILTVAPSSNIERNALGLDPSAFDYEVSAVVFRGRGLPAQPPTNLNDHNANLSSIRLEERIVSARVINRGVGGGELLLERTPTTVTGEPAEDPFNQLKTGRYVMLVGPRPNSTPDAPAVFLAWYRVTAIEVPSSNTTIGGLTPNPITQRVVSLRGPDWPWFPGTPLNLTNTNVLSNDLRLGIFPGVVAVHTRTMRLTSGTTWGE